MTNDPEIEALTMRFRDMLDSHEQIGQFMGPVEIDYAARKLAEAAADQLLPAPPCELCNGWGTVAKFISGPRMAGTINQPCPNGCSGPTLQNSVRGAAGVPEQPGDNSKNDERRIYKEDELDWNSLEEISYEQPAPKCPTPFCSACHPSDPCRPECHICSRARESEVGVPEQARRRDCPFCGRNYKVDPTGRLRKHRMRLDWDTFCHGSGSLSSLPVVVGDPEPATAENVESPRLGGQHLDRGAAAARAPQSAPDSVLSHQPGLRSADLDHTLANLDGETQR